jgi:hypothetical protein
VVGDVLNGYKRTAMHGKLQGSAAYTWDINNNNENNNINNNINTKFRKRGTHKSEESVIYQL